MTTLVARRPVLIVLWHVDRTVLQGRALNWCLRVLDRIGVPGERSLAWVARLPR